MIKMKAGGMGEREREKHKLLRLRVKLAELFFRFRWLTPCHCARWMSKKTIKGVAITTLINYSGISCSGA